jgi:hypothetical protein
VKLFLGLINIIVVFLCFNVSAMSTCVCLACFS